MTRNKNLLGFQNLNRYQQDQIYFKSRPKQIFYGVHNSYFTWNIYIPKELRSYQVDDHHIQYPFLIYHHNDYQIIKYFVLQNSKLYEIRQEVYIIPNEKSKLGVKNHLLLSNPDAYDWFDQLLKNMHLRMTFKIVIYSLQEIDESRLQSFIGDIECIYDKSDNQVLKMFKDEDKFLSQEIFNKFGNPLCRFS